MSLIEGIQVLRDVVIILGFLIITTVTVVVGVKIAAVTQKVEDTRSFVVNVVTAVANPIMGALAWLGGHKR